MATATEELDEAIDESTATEPTQEVAEPPEDCPAHVREHYEAIREKEREVRVLEGNYLDAKEAAGEAKKSFEAADKALRNLISRGADPQLPLKFDEPEAWRAASIDELNLADTLTKFLREDGIETIGQLEDRRAEIIERRGDWPKGIGEEKGSFITETVIAWLTANRDKFGQPEAAEDSTDEPASEADEEATLNDQVEPAFKEAGILDKVVRNVRASANGNAKHGKRGGMAGKPAPKKGKRK